MAEFQSITFQNSRGQTLVGNLFPVPGDAIVIMAPGFCSDKSSQGRFELYAKNLNEKGISAFAIDFAGIGESDDERLTVDKEVDDLRSAIQFAQSKGYQNTGLYGNSLGGLICLKAYSPKIKAIAMTGGLTGPIVNYDWNQYFNPEQMQELKDKGYITERNAQNIHRDSIIIDQQMLVDFEQVDQKQLLSTVKCPVLLIHGDEGEEEQTLHNLSQMGMQYLPSTAALKLIPGATHGFWGHLDKVAILLQECFARHLKR